MQQYNRDGLRIDMPEKKKEEGMFKDKIINIALIILLVVIVIVTIFTR